MMTKDQSEKYKFQQTEAGKDMVQMLQRMKNQYCTKLHIPVDEVKTGIVKALVNGRTGEIERFYEE